MHEALSHKYWRNMPPAILGQLIQGFNNAMRNLKRRARVKLQVGPGYDIIGDKLVTYTAGWREDHARTTQLLADYLRCYGDLSEMTAPLQQLWERMKEQVLQRERQGWSIPDTTPDSDCFLYDRIFKDTN